MRSHAFSRVFVKCQLVKIFCCTQYRRDRLRSSAWRLSYNPDSHPLHCLHLRFLEEEKEKIQVVDDDFCYNSKLGEIVGQRFQVKHFQFSRGQQVRENRPIAASLLLRNYYLLVPLKLLNNVEKL